MSLTSVASVAVALVLRRWSPLLGFFLLVPICGGFLYFDARHVCRWQMSILEMWQDGSLNLADFTETIGSFRYLPTAPLQSMLASLPRREGEFDPEKASKAQKSMMAARLEATGRRRMRAIVVGAGGLVLAVLLLGAAASFRSFTLLAIFAALVAFLMAKRRSAA
jgi:hypothetical protein